MHGLCLGFKEGEGGMWVENKAEGEKGFILTIWAGLSVRIKIYAGQLRESQNPISNPAKPSTAPTNQQANNTTTRTLEIPAPYPPTALKHRLHSPTSLEC